MLRWFGIQFGVMAFGLSRTNGIFGQVGLFTLKGYCRTYDFPIVGIQCD